MSACVGVCACDGWMCVRAFEYISCILQCNLWEYLNKSNVLSDWSCGSNEIPSREHGAVNYLLSTLKCIS